MEVKNIILAIFSAIGSFIANQLGGWDAALAVLIAVMAADYVTGLLVALVWHKSPKTENGGISSAAGYKGLIKKMAILIFVWVGALLDRVIGAEYARTAIIMFYIANEGLSVIENTALMGLPYPAFVGKALEAIKDNNDERGGPPDPEE